jgi:hypothetical protein
VTWDVVEEATRFMETFGGVAFHGDPSNPTSPGQNEFPLEWDVMLDGGYHISIEYDADAGWGACTHLNDRVLGGLYKDTLAAAMHWALTGIAQHTRRTGV